MSVRKVLLLFLVGSTLSACVGEVTPPPTEPPTEPPPPQATPVGIADNNVAVLSGEPIGAGAEGAELLKTVPVRLLGPVVGFELSAVAYLTRSSEDTETIHWIFPVRNLGEARCFVKLTDYRFLDGEGDALTENASRFVAGSVGLVSTSVHTATCLDAGEAGFFLGIAAEDEVPLFSAAAALEVSGLDSNDEPPRVPDARVIPQDYALERGGVLEELRVSVQNEGEEAARLTSSTYVLLGADDTPLHWGFLDAPRGTTLPPGASATLSSPVFYSGLAQKLRARVDFEGEPTTTIPFGIPFGLSDRQRLHLRDAREAAKARVYGGG